MENKIRKLERHQNISVSLIILIVIFECRACYGRFYSAVADNEDIMALLIGYTVSLLVHLSIAIIIPLLLKKYIVMYRSRFYMPVSILIGSIVLDYSVALTGYVNFFNFHFMALTGCISFFMGNHFILVEERKDVFEKDSKSR